jgi:hypothetical protein
MQPRARTVWSASRTHRRASLGARFYRIHSPAGDHSLPNRDPTERRRGFDSLSPVRTVLLLTTPQQRSAVSSARESLACC